MIFIGLGSTDSLWNVYYMSMKRWIHTYILDQTNDCAHAIKYMINLCWYGLSEFIVPDQRIFQLDEEKIIDNLSEVLLDLRRQRMSHLPKVAIIEELKPSESLSTLPSNKKVKKKKKNRDMNNGGNTLPSMHMTSLWCLVFILIEAGSLISGQPAPCRLLHVCHELGFTEFLISNYRRFECWEGG